MAWTTPKTWSAGETLTAANFNTHIRDNLNAIFPIIRLRKTADETVTSSAVLQDDDHLTFAIAANEIWILELMLLVNAGSAGGFKGQITAPAGASGISQTFNDTTGGSVTGSSTSVNATFFAATLTITDEPFWVRATVVNGATPGNCLLQWAQNASSGTGTIVKQNSHMLAHRIS
jgi:hypothetical protein